MEMTLNYDDQKKFKDWLDLNLTSISWEGRYLEEFNLVWGMIYHSPVLVTDQFNLLSSLKNNINQGPVICWIDWLIQKYLCFLFIEKNISVEELALLSQLDVDYVSLTLRNFFIDHFPQFDEEINNLLHTGNRLSLNRKRRFVELKDRLSVGSIKNKGTIEEEVLTSLEVTLYSDWQKIKTFLYAKNSLINKPEEALREIGFFNNKVKFLSELLILFIIGGLLIFLIKVGNKSYENYLIEKISLFSPQFFWLDKNLSFKNVGDKITNNINIQSDELDELEKIENKKVFDDIQSSTRYEVESDVVLTSVDTLPKDFEVAGLELSNYEEERKGGYRNSRYGRRKAYRVMMTSVNPPTLKKQIISSLEKYKVKQVDNVRPGTSIPGGIYFNLYVPRKELQKFMLEVTSLEEHSTILESRTVFSGPKNTDKVFIWIKNI